MPPAEASWCIHTRAALGWDGIGCAGNSVYFSGGVHR